MRIRTTILAGAFLLACSSAAVAQSSSGFYAGLGIGKSKANLNSADFTFNRAGVSESKDETDTGYKLLIGYRFFKYLGVELGYADLGKFSYNYDVAAFSPAGKSRIDYKTTSMNASAVATIPLKGDLSALVRLGVTSNRAERSDLHGDVTLIANTAPSASKRKTSLLWGLGGEYATTANTAVRLEFESYGNFGEARSGSGFTITETGQAKVHMWSLTGLYRF